MEKDQLDSLATVAVGSEKIPPPHSHYAASEVYSASESPPAYTRPSMKSSAVQITRIIATTLIAMSVIIGSFILASAWLTARASCTPESIAAMQAQMSLQQNQNEFIKHLHPEALVQDRPIPKDNLQTLSDSPSTTDKDEVQADTKNIKVQNNDDTNSKVDNDSGDQNDDDDDYDDSEFPPVHIKLPLQLDLDDLAGSLLQQARSIVSCVVERRRADEVMDGANDNSIDNNSTERQRVQRLSGERVAIICESGDPRQEQQEQEMLTPIIVPLGTVQIPLPSRDPGYNRYQVHNRFQVSEAQRVPMPVDARGMNAPFPIGILPPELRNLPQVSMEMGPPPRMAPQPHMIRQQTIEMHQIPIEIRHVTMDLMRGMKSAAEQEQFNQEQQQQPQQQPIPMMYAHADRPSMMYPQEQQTQGMMPPPPPPSQPQSAHESQQHIHEQRIPSMMIPPRVEQRQPTESHEVPDRSDSFFHGIPMDINRIIQQVPLEIKNILDRLNEETRPVQSSVPEGARREVQEFKPIPEGLRSIALDPLGLSIEVRNLFEHGNMEGNNQQNAQDSDEQQQQSRSFPSSEEQSEETEMRQFPIPASVLQAIRQVAGGHVVPISPFAMPLRPIESLEVPVEARAQVSDNQATEEHTQQQEEQTMPQQHQPQSRMMVDHEEMQEEINRPHFVQPRSVRSVPEVFAPAREKRVRRYTCNCAC